MSLSDIPIEDLKKMMVQSGRKNIIADILDIQSCMHLFYLIKVSYINLSLWSKAIV